MQEIDTVCLDTICFYVFTEEGVNRFKNDF